MIFEEPQFSGDQLVLEYQRPFDDQASDVEKLGACAGVVLGRMLSRLGADELEILNDPELWTEENIGYNYVLESLCQIKMASQDPQGFVDDNDLAEADLIQLNESLEALCKPALIVDGQHRLYGAAYSQNDNIWLPVVAIPNCPWMEQIYQFVVINEKAKKVDSPLLTDIFGSSLTPTEQSEIRSQLSIANANIDPRIAAVIAGRDPQSPFFDMVKLALDGQPPGGRTGFHP